MEKKGKGGGRREGKAEVREKGRKFGGLNDVTEK